MYVQKCICVLIKHWTQELQTSIFNKYFKILQIEQLFLFRAVLIKINKFIVINVQNFIRQQLNILNNIF